MKNLFSILSLVTLFIITTSIYAQDSDDKQTKEKKQIKNETKTASMTQTKAQNQNKNEVKTATMTQTKGQHRVGFVDEDGDGVDDNVITTVQDPKSDVGHGEGAGAMKRPRDRDQNGKGLQNSGDGAGLGTGSENGSKNGDGSGKKAKKKSAGNK